MQCRDRFIWGFSPLCERKRQVEEEDREGGSNNKQNKTEEELPFSFPPSRGGGGGLGLIELVLLGSERRRRRRKSCSQGCQPLSPSSWLLEGGIQKLKKTKKAKSLQFRLPLLSPPFSVNILTSPPKLGQEKKGGGAKLLSLFLSPSR